MIRSAQIEEISQLSEIAFISKAYWGYDATFMELCRNELTITIDILQNNYCFVAEEDNEIMGFYLLSKLSVHRVEMEMLFIVPEFIGKGIGKLLFEHAVGLAKSKNYSVIEIQADPFAERFYEKMGAHLIDYKPSGSITGRKLPYMSYKLK